MPSPIQYEYLEENVSTDESMVDPIGRAKLPGAKPVLPKISKVKSYNANACGTECFLKEPHSYK